MNPAAAPGGLDEALFAPPPPGPDVEVPVTIFASTGEWMTGWLQRFATRPALWCDDWAAHPDAASRLHDLWQAWEVAVGEGGTAMSSWWLLHFDGHAAALGAARGPFARCQAGHTLTEPWRTLR